MKLILLGTGSFGVPALEAVMRAGHGVARCISQPDRPAGRGRQIQPTPIHEAANRLGIPHIQAPDINALDVCEVASGAELGLVVAFGQKIGPALLAAFPRGCINIHGSLLPKYRGAAPYQWAILNGESETGVTVFQLNERWDAGATWAVGRTPIGELETADELHDRLALLGAEVIVTALQRIERGEQPAPQDAAQATRAPKLSRANSAVDWTQPAARIVHQIHGLWSWPTATCIYASAGSAGVPPVRIVVQLARARAIVRGEEVGMAHPTGFAPGTFRDDLTVQCGTGAVQLLEVKPAGGKLMAFRDFANGRRVAAGDRLLPPEPAV